MFGANRVGIKLSPVNDYNDIADSDPITLIDHTINMLNKKNIGFVELTEAFSLEGREAQLKKAFYENKKEKSFREIFKRKFKNTWITNSGFTLETANEAIQKGETDLVSFG